MRRTPCALLYEWFHVLTTLSLPLLFKYLQELQRQEKCRNTNQLHSILHCLLHCQNWKFHFSNSGRKCIFLDQSNSARKLVWSMSLLVWIVPGPNFFQLKLTQRLRIFRAFAKLLGLGRFVLLEGPSFAFPDSADILCVPGSKERRQRNICRKTFSILLDWQ